MRILLSVVVALFVLPLHAQRCDWLARTDCGGGIDVRQLCVDAHGNVYTSGQYTGEVLFHSADLGDTSITKYTDNNWHKTYIARHDAAGRLRMVVQFKTSGSNQSLTYSEGLQVLPNGDIVIFIEGGGEFVGPTGDHFKTGENGRGGNLHCIDSLGNLKWSARVPIKYCNFLEVSPNGCVYVFGNSMNEYTGDKLLVKYSPTGAPLDTIYTGGPSFKSLCFKGTKLYVLAVNGAYGNFADRTGKNKLFEMPADNFGLFELDTVHLATRLMFSKPMPVIHGWERDGVGDFRAWINFTSAELFVDLMLVVDSKVTFMDKDYTRLPNNMQLFRMNKSGNLVASRGFNSDYSNYAVAPGPEGTLYISFGVWGKFFKYGNDSIALPTYSDFTIEQVLMKLDKNLNRLWWSLAGATASNYHSTKLVPGVQGDLYIASDLLAPGNVFGRKVEIPWWSETYVAKLVE